MPVLLYGDEADDLFQQGKSAYSAKDYNEAYELFGRVVRLEPGVARYQYNLGLAARKLNKYGVAANAFTEAKRLDPAIGFTNNRDEFERKLSDMLRMAETDSGDDPALKAFTNGKSAYKSKDYIKAFDYFQLAVNLEPGNAQYQYNLGLAARKLNKYETAANAFREAKRLDPEISFTKNREDFEKKLDEMIRNTDGKTGNPDAAAQFKQGEKEYKEKDYSNAHYYFSEAVKLEPQNAKYQYNLGLAARKLKRYPEAVAAFQEAARLDPEITFTKDKQGFKDKLEEAIRLSGSSKSSQSDDYSVKTKSSNKEGGGSFVMIFLVTGVVMLVTYLYNKKKRSSSSSSTYTRPADEYDDYTGTKRYKKSTSTYHGKNIHTTSTNTKKHTYSDRS